MLRVVSRWSPAVRVPARHSQVRSMLYRRVFWNVWHYLLWRSLASLAALGWLRRIHDLVECWASRAGSDPLPDAGRVSVFELVSGSS